MKKATKTCNIKFGDNLFNTRKSKNVSQTQIAELCNVSRQSVSDWETGKSQPDFVNLVKIAQHFNVSTDFLLGLTTVSSTNKATKELCDTLGLSETAIDILQKKPNSALADDIKDMFSHIKDESVRESAPTKLLNSITEEIQSVINKLIEDYIANNCYCEGYGTANNFEKPLIELLHDFYKALESPKEKYICGDDNNFRKIDNKLLIGWMNDNGTPHYDPINIKEVMVNSAIGKISTRLYNIKDKHIGEEERKQQNET